MAVTVTMPQLGETVTEGTILSWAKQPGDTIAEDEVLLEISTDKVDTEVPSPAAGVIREILVAEGTTVSVGTPPAIIGASRARMSGGTGGGARGRAEPEPEPRPSGSRAALPRPAGARPRAPLPSATGPERPQNRRRQSRPRRGSPPAAPCRHAKTPEPRGCAAAWRPSPVVRSWPPRTRSTSTRSSARGTAAGSPEGRDGAHRHRSRQGVGGTGGGGRAPPRPRSVKERRGSAAPAPAAAAAVAEAARPRRTRPRPPQHRRRPGWAASADAAAIGRSPRIAANMVLAQQTAANVWTSVEVDFEAVEQVVRRTRRPSRTTRASP